MDVIKELGITLHTGFLDIGAPHTMAGEFIYASELRAAIEKLTVVYGSEAFNGHLTWNPKKQTFNTHKARLIGVEELVKEPMRVERQFLNEKPDYCYGSIEVPSQIKGKPFKVVFEEVIE